MRFWQFKKGFTPDGEPLSLRVELENDPNRNIRRHRLRVPQIDMKREVFDPVILDVLDLVHEQITMCRRGVTAVLMVGGFGQSLYLMSRIKDSVNPSIRILQPENGWTAVVQGAAMIGLDRAGANLANVHISERVARKHYGTELERAYDKNIDDPSKKLVVVDILCPQQLIF